MDTDQTLIKNLPHEGLTGEIIGAAFEVYNTLGYGFLERVYQKALQAELIGRGLRAEIEHPLKVMYKGTIVGDYFVDLLIEEVVVVELKIAAGYNPQDEAQLLNELKASGIKVGLLINFGRTKVEFKRLVF